MVALFQFSESAETFVVAEAELNNFILRPAPATLVVHSGVSVATWPGNGMGMGLC